MPGCALRPKPGSGCGFPLIPAASSECGAGDTGRVDRGAREDHEDAQPLVGGESVLRMRRDEDRLSLHDGYRCTLDLEDAAAFEDDVQLVVRVRLLVVRLGSDQDVDAASRPGEACTISYPPLPASRRRLTCSISKA